MSYTFTSNQLYVLLSDTIKMFVEYRDVHGRTETQARPDAISEMFQGLDDRELVEGGEVKESLQVLSRYGLLDALNDLADVQFVDNTWDEGQIAKAEVTKIIKALCGVQQ